MKRKISKAQKAYRNEQRKKKRKFLLKCSGRLNGKMPKSEKWFREKLEDYGLYKRFKKNTPLYRLGVIPDLHDKEYMIVIEVDGSIHQRADVIERDLEKDQIYKNAGYKVFRVIHGDEDGAYKVLDELVEIYRKPSKKQIERSIRNEKKRQEIAAKNKVLTPEEQVEAIARILGTKKTKPGKYYS